jgi:asparagine synthetase B (glutamine-hydrolysing)
MSDVPLGVFLSGGLDSSALAAMVAQAARRAIQTFAVGFEDREPTNWTTRGWWPDGSAPSIAKCR